MIQNPIIRKKKVCITALDYRIMRGCKPGVLMPPPVRGARSCSAHASPWGVGSGRCFCIASQMRGFTAVPECGVDFVFVRCRWLLKYINY